ncbi:MAG: SusC/RagA family TonB-linked outer membrane protein [Gemmatimonadota bacterium]
MKRAFVSWSRRTVAHLAAGLSALLAGTTLLQAQGSGSITGRVTDARSGAPVPAARVFITGTSNGTQTSEDGRYTIRVLTPGAHDVTVARLGYEARRLPVTVAAGGPTTLDIQLTQATFSLAEVVTTVTGQQRKVELGNAVATINVAEKLADIPVSDVGELLSGRAAGIQVVQSGATGSGARIRIRGQGSLSLNNEPLVYVDGVRIASNTGSSAIGVGGSSPSRLNDINPEEIENIEVIKGPSAATLYGTEAANGVINITTKKGRAGRTQWQIYSEAGRFEDPNTYPDLYYLWGTPATGNPVSQRCVLSQIAAGSCRVDSLTTLNVLNDPETTVLSTGLRQQLGAQMSGGNDRVQFFASGEWENERGNYKMPQFEIDRLRQERGVSELPDEHVYPNALRRISTRTNLTAQINPKADVQVSAAYITSEQRLPQNEDNGNGLMVAALGGLALAVKDSRGVDLRGYRSFSIGDVLSRVTTQDLQRFVNSVAANYRPSDWLSTRATLGLDFASRYDEGLNLFDQGVFNFPTRNGTISSNRTELAQYTADAGATARRRLFNDVESKTSVGIQYFRNFFARTSGTGETLPPGARTVNTAAVRNTSQNTDETITLGTYIEQTFSYNERLFVTGAVRADDNSAFGAQFDAVIYPKFSASWVVSEEGFFPQSNWLSSLRLRATYGASGAQPGTTDALRFYNGVGATLTGQVEVPGVTLGALGNADLRPEYSAETEAGFDANIWNNRLNLELTYYNKKTRDALISRNVAPSLGGVAARFENIGSVRNTGFEVLVNTRLLDRRVAALDLTVTGSTNKNRLLTLGEGVSPIPSGNRNTQLNIPGYPLYGLWGRPVSFNDANGDGIIVASEITYGNNQFIGSSFPTREIAVSPTVELLNRRLRINTQLDHKSGMKKLNNTLRHQCQGGQSCRGLYDKTAPLADQAAAIAANANVFTSFYDDGAFTRLRELAVTWQLPDAWARRVSASRLSITGTGRNLAVWTDYRGVDPEATVGNSDTRGNEEFFSTPPLRMFTLRANLSF